MISFMRLVPNITDPLTQAFSFHMKFVEEITHVKEVLEFCGDQEVEVDVIHLKTPCFKNITP